MKRFSDRELLEIWEFGLNHSVIETSLLLLAYRYPKYDINEVASFSIGERDARLLKIRESLFGPLLQNTADCPVCSQKMEWEIDVQSIQIQPIKEVVEAQQIQLDYQDYQLSLRLPNSHDILEVMGEKQVDSQVQHLIRKCILTSTLPPDLLQPIPADLENDITRKMEESDPQANIVMNLCCAECGHKWDSIFDIGQYLWQELNEWAIQLLKDVYLLASNFGWTEKDILDMGRFRRNLYINMILR